MRGSGLAALFLLLILAAALSTCSAKPASLEWPRGSAVPAVNYNQLVLMVDSVSEISEANATGILTLRVLDSNGTAVQNATVFAFSSEEVVFETIKQWADRDGVVRFAFRTLVEPYSGMAVIASAMKLNHTEISILVPIVQEVCEPPAPEVAGSPDDPADSAAIAVAAAVGIISMALYAYWNRGM
jgi:hypothetical protein